jgi:branched-chain amino acid aminotransferase
MSESSERSVAWIDGRIVELGEARIPVTDHGFLYGDGIFEGMRAMRRHLFRLDDHMRRFAASARALDLALPGGIDAVRSVLLETLRASGRGDAYVRLIATRGEGALGVDPTSCPVPRLICIVDQLRVYPPEKLESGIELVTSSWRRPPADVLDPRVKSLNYLNNALAKLEARQRGADEALLLTLSGHIAEATVANVFCAREGTLFTPPGSDGALEGITRRTLIELARADGVAVRQQSLGRFDLLAAEEVFLSGSGAGVVPVRSLDGRVIGAGRPGDCYRRLRAAYLASAERLGTPY